MTANEGTRREKRGRQLSLPTMMRLSDCAVRFLLTAVLAGAELMEIGRASCRERVAAVV